MVNLHDARKEKTVEDKEVNPYLLNDLLARLSAGEDVTYGEVDFSRFEADDLRTLACYCEEKDHMTYRLSTLLGVIDNAEAYCCKARAFC